MLVEDAGISPEARGLIAGQIDSVVQLEMLLLLFTDPQQVWSSEDVAKELRIEPAWAAAQLELLGARGLLSVADADGRTWRYGPNTVELARGVEALNREYAERRVTVISLIYSKPPADPVRNFADAFRLRRDTPDG